MLNHSRPSSAANDAEFAGTVKSRDPCCRELDDETGEATEARKSVIADTIKEHGADRKRDNMTVKD